MISAEIAVSGYILPAPPIPRIPSGRSSLEQSRVFADLQKRFAEGHEILKDQSESFDKLFRVVHKSADISAEDIEMIAESILASKLRNESQIIGAIRQIDQAVEERGLSGAALRIAEEARDICCSWLELFDNLQIRLMKLASDRRAERGEQGSPIFSDGDAAAEYLRRRLE